MLFFSFKNGYLHFIMIRKSILGSFLLVLLLASCKKESKDPTPTPSPNPTPITPIIPLPGGDNDNLLLGNPTNAQAVSTSADNYLLNHVYWVASYNNSRGISNWVSWHLQSEDQGSVARQDDFRYDDALPSSFYLVQNNSYSGSGFDRGHNCPSGDRTASVSANSSTFYMTNMIPQAPMFNQGPWEGMEDYIRGTLVGTSNEAYIIMGSYGQGGIASNTTVATINGGHVTVPKNVWKVVVVLPKGNGDLARINDSTTVLAVNMPNNNTLYSTSTTGKNAWRNYITTISSIEQSSAAEGASINLIGAVNAAVRTNLKNKLYH